jgi:hypothetical protein
VRCSSPRIIRLLRSVSWTKLRRLIARGDGTEPRQRPLDAPTFPPAATALLESLGPDYQKTLTTLNEAAVHL